MTADEMNGPDRRDQFEAAVCERMAESGFLEIEVRTEALIRCGDGYQDPIINASWDFFNLGMILGPRESKESNDARSLCHTRTVWAADKNAGDSGMTQNKIDWIFLDGWVDPPESPDGFKIEVQIEPYLGTVYAYRFVPLDPEITERKEAGEDEKRTIFAKAFNEALLE